MSKETTLLDPTPEEEDEYLEQLWGIKCEEEDHPFNESLSQNSDEGSDEEGESEEECDKDLSEEIICRNLIRRSLEEDRLKEIYEEDKDEFHREVSKKFEDHVWLFTNNYSVTVHKIYNSLNAFAKHEKFDLSPKSFTGDLFEWMYYTYTLEPLKMIF